MCYQTKKNLYNKTLKICNKHENKLGKGKLKCSYYGVITEVTMVRNIDSSSEFILCLCAFDINGDTSTFLTYNNKILQPEEGIFVFL